MEYTIEGLSIVFIAGKNASDNTNLINSSEENDIWFHLADGPSSHVVAKVHNLVMTRKQRKAVIRKGAKISKMISKHSSTKSLAISYSLIKDVITTNVPGGVILNNCTDIIV